MSEQNVTHTNHEGAAEAAPFNIFSEVKSAIEKQTPVVKGQVIQSLVDKELSRFQAAVLKVMELLAPAKGEVKKFEKPDTITYNLDGTEKDKSYSKATLDSFKAANEKVKKIEDALEQALVHNDYKKVLELAK